MIQTEKHGKVGLQGIQGNILTAEKQIAQAEIDLENAKVKSVTKKFTKANKNKLINQCQAKLDNYNTSKTLWESYL